MAQVLTPAIDPAIRLSAELVLWAAGSQYRAGQPLSSLLTTLGVSAFIQTLLDDVDAATARTTLGVSQAKATFAAVATTSGTSIDFTGIPAGVTRITLNFSGVSTSGGSVALVQVGDSGGVETAGYATDAVTVVGGAATNSTSVTGFTLPTALATARRNGTMVLNLINAATFLWAATWIIGDNINGVVMCGESFKATSAALDRVRLTTVAGTDTFDAGSMNISWEF